MRLAWDIPFVGFRRINQMSEQLQAIRWRLVHPDTPVIEVLAVDTGAQGQRLATRLLDTILADVDARGKPCYLEATRQRNVSWYERRGFRVCEELPFGPGDRVWCLVRD